MPRACPSCGETLWKKEIRASSPDSRTFLPLRLIECSGCQLVYLPEIPLSKSLYFTHYYGQPEGLAHWVFEPFNRYWTRKKARRLMALAAGSSWLDYGCGRGDLLEALSTQGAEVYGIETQRDCAERLQTRWKNRIGEHLDDLKLPPATLHGTAFYHVLEHVANPRELLAQLRSHSRPNAVLFIAVPNWDAWERSCFGDRWFHLDVPRHVQHFTPATLSRLLKGSGWVPRDIHFKVRAYDVFGLFQSLLNVGPGPRNYFYRRLKRGESFQGSDRWVGLAWNVLAVLPAAVIALVLTPLLACLRRTGTFEVTAIPLA